MLGRFEDVLDGDETAQLAVAIDDQHALEAVLMHQLLRRFEFGALGDRDEPVAFRHDVGDRLIQVRLEAKVAIGDDADNTPPFDNRKTGNLVLLRERQDLPDRHRRRNRDRVLDDAAFEAFDLRNLGRLLGGRHILMDDAEAPLLSDRDGEPGFGHGVHRRRKQRDVERDRSRKARR